MNGLNQHLQEEWSFCSSFCTFTSSSYQKTSHNYENIHIFSMPTTELSFGQKKKKFKQMVH